MRLHQILQDAIRHFGGQVFQGMEVIGCQRSGDERIEVIYTDAAARPLPHTADNYILATGGVLGGGISTNHTGAVYDPIFDLPLQAPLEVNEWLKRDFLHPEGHPILGAGVRTNENFKTRYDNLFVIGGGLAGDFVRERSLEGVALISGYQIAEVLS
jgi:glycerol-3-phosphate dehydrogenase subunit B